MSRWPLKSHCRRGHPLSGDNLYTTPKGYRHCRACGKLNDIDSRQRRDAGEITAQVKANFCARVDRRGPDECWLWNGGLARKGYGRLGIRSAAHIALELDGRPRPGKDYCALHSCDNPPCCNPKHLSWGTNLANVADKLAKKRDQNQRKTHCIRGHPLSGDNLLTPKEGWRACRTCQRQNELRYYAKIKAERRQL